MRKTYKSGDVIQCEDLKQVIDLSRELNKQGYECSYVFTKLQIKIIKGKE